MKNNERPDYLDQPPAPDLQNARPDYLNQLPNIVLEQVCQHLSGIDIANFGRSGMIGPDFFKPIYDRRMRPMSQMLMRFLTYVAQGKHEKVASMLTKDLRGFLLCNRAMVTDYSGRTFEDISAFEYALWALDRHMWEILLSCIPHDEKGKKIYEQLLAQYNRVATQGVTYTLHGTTITEQHFNFENTIIMELQMQVNARKAEGDKNWEAINQQLITGVGGAQRLLPMHVVYEYCSEIMFEVDTTFTVKPENSQVYFDKDNVDRQWFINNRKLGSEHAIVKFGAMTIATRGKIIGLTAICEINLSAMKDLYNVRTYDFNCLKSKLENELSPDLTSQISSMCVLQ